LNCAFGDGSVHYISNSVTLQIFKAMATIKGREVVSQTEY